MTCLYCGKKLGFFSRYKDTPFCSEEHLREHQTELEQALIERLGGAGTKGSPAAAGRGGRDSNAQSSPFNSPPKTAETRSGPTSSAPSVHELERKSSIPSTSTSSPDPRSVEIQNVSRAHSDKAAETASTPHWSEMTDLSAGAAPAPQAPSRPAVREQRHGNGDPNSILNLPRPLADTPVDVAAFGDNAPKRPREEYSPGPPLSEKFFGDFPPVNPDLNVSKPWMSPSTFAVIVQADCCVPTLPAPTTAQAPEGDDEQFEIDLAAMPLQHLPLEPIDNRGGTLQPFGENWLFFPEEATREALCIGQSNPYSAQDELLALEYEAESEVSQFSPLGHRDAIPPRTRQRFPYPASQVLSMDQNFPIAIDSMPLGTGFDWDPIELVPIQQGELSGPIEAWDEKQAPPLFARQENPLTHSALEDGLDLAESLELAAPQDFDVSELRELTRLPAPFEASAFFEPNAADSLQAHGAILLPQAGAEWQPESVFPRATAEYRSPAVNFPTLFQLGPSLPPRPADRRPN